jgi:predicted AlkP superfamily phosphohydrolase/phosphomutase
MKPSIIAIGLDAASLPLLEEWMAQGHLPALAALRAASAQARLEGGEVCRAEIPWTCFLTGCEPEQTGFWNLLRFLPRDYAIDDIGAYDFAEYPPFYQLGDAFRVAAVDLPQSRLVDGVNGVQIVAWGAHSPLAPRGSRPDELLGEIERRIGPHPALLRDEATLWRAQEMERLEEWLKVGIARRADICAHLMAQERWDLLVTVFGEMHSAGHYLWHRSPQGHPLHRSGDHDSILAIYKAVDAAVARIRAGAPPETYCAIVAVHGMESNSMDLTGMAFLPELLYRMSFPGRRGIGAQGVAGASTDPQRPPRAWVPAMWSTQANLGAMRRFLRTYIPSRLAYPLDRLWPDAPDSLSRPIDSGKLSYQPAMWYRKLWPRMRAFALPTFSEGYVRINVEGREAAGIVAPADYRRVCDEVAAEIERLVDARSGRPIVREVRRTRESAMESSPSLPDADLIVRWEPFPTDVVDSPTLGRIGPLPYNRSGGHTENGFLWISGPGIDAGAHLPDGRPTSVAPTLLALLGAPVPEYMMQPPLLAPNAADGRR